MVVGGMSIWYSPCAFWIRIWWVLQGHILVSNRNIDLGQPEVLASTPAGVPPSWDICFRWGYGMNGESSTISWDGMKCLA